MSPTPPPPSLDPHIQAKLAVFGRRRRQLIRQRGLYAFVATAILALVLVALIDRLVLLEDLPRQALSYVAYLAAFAVLGWSCLRWYLRPASARDLARLLEQCEPAVRNHILSAVELGDARTRFGLWDSAQFRALVQKQAASRLKEVHVFALLPDRLIVRWLYAALASAALLLGLLFVPGLHFDRLFLRALLPMANLPRVSRVGIAIVDPNPADAIVPQGSPVTVKVALSGPPVTDAWLESIPTHGARSRVRMQLLGKSEFTAALQIGRESVQYRVRAGDALSRRYQLQAFPQPQVTAFAKTYRYPTYTRLPPRTLTETGGDLEAVEGTAVEVVFHTDQSVERGNLELTLAGKTSNALLENLAPRALRGALTLSKPGTYKVRLISAITQFENRFSAEYEIRVKADLLPQVTIDRPERDVQALPDAVVRIEGTVKDDFAVPSAELAYRVNQGNWQTVAVAVPAPAAVLGISQPLELAKLNVKPGDQLSVKLAATDLKGNRAESAVLRIGVKAADGQAAGLNRVRDGLRQLRETLQQLEPVARKAAEEVASQTSDATQRKQALLKLAAGTDDAKRQAAEARDRLRDALRRTPTPEEGRPLVALGRLLSALERNSLATADDRVRQAETAADRQQAQQDTAAAGEALRQAAQQAAALESVATSLAAADKNPQERQRLAQELDARLTPSAQTVDKLARQATDAARPGQPDAQARRAATDWADAAKHTAAELRDRAGLEELRRNPDHRFAHDLARTADAVDKLGDTTAPARLTEAADSAKELSRDLQALEAKHALQETAARIAELAQQERGALPAGAEAKAEAREWRATDRDLQGLEKALRDSSLPHAADAAAAASRSPEAETVRREMTQRENAGKAGDSLRAPLERLAVQLDRAEQLAAPAAAQTRQNLASHAPPLSEQLGKLAGQADELARRDRELAAPPASPPAANGQDALRKQAEAQNHFDEQLEQARDALRRDANAQDLTTPDGRERARDGDDALAMLQPPTPKPTELLRHALVTPNPETRRDALTQAAQQQSALADRLEKLEEHFRNAEATRADATRPELRQAEAKLGVKPALDAEYAKIDELAALARQDPEAARAALEKELPNNAAMQHELADLARGTLAAAADDLKQVSEQEAKLADQVRQLAQAQAPQTQALQERARQVADKARLLADKEIPAVSQQAGPANPDAERQLERAAQLLDRVADDMPRDLTAAGDTAARTVAELAKDLERSRSNLQQATEKLDTSARAAQQTSRKAQESLTAARTQAEQEAQKAQAEAAQRQAAAQQAKQAEQAAENELRNAQQAHANAEKEKAAAEKALRTAQLAGKGTEDPAVRQAEATRAQAAAKEETARAGAEQAGAKAAAARQAAHEATAAQQNAQAAASAARTLANEAATPGKGGQGREPDPDRLAPARDQRTRQLAQQAEELARRAGELGNRELPALAAQAKTAGSPAQRELEQAATKLAATATKVPREFSAPSPALGQQLDGLARELGQSRTALDSAADGWRRSAEAARDNARKANAELVRAQVQERQEKGEAETGKTQVKAALQKAAQEARKREQADAALRSAQEAVAKGKGTTPAALQQLEGAAAAARKAEETAKQAAQSVAEKAAKAQLEARQSAQALAAAQKAADQAGQALARTAGNPAAAGTPSGAEQAEAAATETAELARRAAEMAAETRLLAQQEANRDALRKTADALRSARENSSSAQQALGATQAPRPGVPGALERARQAAQQNGELARQANELANDLQRLAQQTDEPLNKAAAQQDQLAEQTRAAAADIARAGRHEQRLGQPQGRALTEVGRKTAATADGEMATAEQALAKATTGSQAAPAVGKARDASQQRLNDLAAALKALPPTPAPEAAKGDAQPQVDTPDEASGKWLARALDNLDGGANPERPDSQAPGAPPATPPGTSPSAPSAPKADATARNSSTPATPATPSPAAAANPGGQQPQTAALQAMRAAVGEAVQVQAEALAAQRNEGRVPGQPAAIAALPATQKAPDGIALAAMGGGPAAPAVGAGVNVNWGKLPPRLAKDFLASRSENVPPEYRAMVDNYFKAVAEKARAK